MSTALDYPMARYPSWITRELRSSTETSSNPKHGKFSTEGSRADSNEFVLFVRLPAWKNVGKHAETSRKVAPENNIKKRSISLGEIRTLRNLHQGVEVYKVKGTLELTTGIPSHVALLCDIDGKCLNDDVSLLFGQNIKSGDTLHLKVKSAYEAIVKSVCEDRIEEVLKQLGHHTKEKRGLEFNLQNLESAVENNLTQNAFCALFFAAAIGKLQTCKTILKYGTEPNLSSVIGNTALHSATYNGHLDIIELLVAYGANIRCRNIRGKSPLDVAVELSLMECARWLWLNQWSISITKNSLRKNPEKSISTPHHQTYDVTQDKPRPSSSSLLRTPNHVSHHISSYKTLHRDKQRPRSTPAIWERSKMRKSLPPNWIPAHPKQAWKRNSDVNILHQPNQATNKTVLPRITPVLTRERSIPSKHETRMSPNTPDFAVGLNTNKPSLSPIIIPQPSTTPACLPTKTYLLQLNSNKDINIAPKKSPRPKPLCAQIETKASADLPETSREEGVEVIEVNNQETNDDGNKDQPVNQETNDLFQTDQVNNSVEPIFRQNLNPENEEKDLFYSVMEKKKEVSQPSQSTYSAHERVSSEKKKKGHLFAEEKQRELEKQKEIRKDKSEKAYQEWLASKHKQFIQRRNNETNQMKLNPVGSTKVETANFAPRSWEITFEQWLETKKNKQPTKTDLDTNRTFHKRSKSLENGKTFDDWMKEKRRQSVEKPLNTRGQTEEEKQKLEEMRERKFTAWYKSKVEETNKRRREEEKKAKQQTEEMKQYYDDWKKTRRVKSFEEWKKQKQKEKRLNMMDNAQKESLQCVSEWMALDRQELAQSEFTKWRLRKESLSLERAQVELMEARELRKKAEQKARLKRAWLKARTMLNWKNITLPDKRNPLNKSDDTGKDSFKAIETNQSVNKLQLDEGFSEFSDSCVEDYDVKNVKSDSEPPGLLGELLKYDVSLNEVAEITPTHHDSSDDNAQVLAQDIQMKPNHKPTLSYSKFKDTEKDFDSEYKRFEKQPCRRNDKVAAVRNKSKVLNGKEKSKRKLPVTPSSKISKASTDTNTQSSLKLGSKLVSSPKSPPKKVKRKLPVVPPSENDKTTAQQTKQKPASSLASNISESPGIKSSSSGSKRVSSQTKPRVSSYASVPSKIAFWKTDDRFKPKTKLVKHTATTDLGSKLKLQSVESKKTATQQKQLNKPGKKGQENGKYGKNNHNLNSNARNGSGFKVKKPSNYPGSISSTSLESQSNTVVTKPSNNVQFKKSFPKSSGRKLPQPTMRTNKTQRKVIVPKSTEASPTQQNVKDKVLVEPHTTVVDKEQDNVCSKVDAKVEDGPDNFARENTNNITGDDENDGNVSVEEQHVVASQVDERIKSAPSGRAVSDDHGIKIEIFLNHQVGEESEDETRHLDDKTQKFKPHNSSD
nr:ankyrin repeat domain-containing protein 11-like [Ciona intestinalis]|eukprot:XP_002122568.1 ankyrin repeat domain-containing protein 11-like [Ciona intestinalis]